jgi:type II secretory pathway predicted ATPase ExeA/Flp pilus assembly protein TadD
MYEVHYGLRTKPFTLLPDPAFLFLGNRHKMALTLLEYGLLNRSAFIVITGEPGTGKTTLLNQLLDQSRHQWTIGLLSNIRTELGSLMPWLMASFGLPTKGLDQVELFQTFSQFLEQEYTASRRVLLVIDEAQNIGAPMLEELRLLSNLNDGRRRAVQILLSGQPGLRDLLRGPGMVQFAQRIGVEYTLDALEEDETAAYITHRLQVAGRSAPLFTGLACRVIFKLTGGIPRLINQLCDHALVYGYAAQAVIITGLIVLNSALARNRNSVLPFMASPAEIRLAPEDMADEQAESDRIIARSSSGATELHSGEAQSQQDPDMVYRQAIALKQAGHYLKAIGLFETLEAAESWGTKALAQKGLCLKAIGRYEEALAAVRAALERQPGSPQEARMLQYLLARTLEAQGSYAEAVSVYRTLESGQRPYRDVADRLARLDKGQPGRANLVSAPPTWMNAVRRSFGQLLRGMQG